MVVASESMSARSRQGGDEVKDGQNQPIADQRATPATGPLSLLTRFAPLARRGAQAGLRAYHSIRQRWVRWALDLPRVLLGVLLFAGLLTVATQAGKYGITVDEPLQEKYGRSVLAWYRTLGKDASFLTTFAPDTHMPEHGGIFDASIALAQAALPAVEPWYLRHLLTGLCGLGGVLAIALCGYELGGGWLALVAALGLWLYPRYYGAIYNNPKDVPAAVAMTVVLWAALLLVKHWGAHERPRRYLRDSAMVGCCIGVAAAIRVNAVIWYAILAVLLAGWWLLHGARAWRERRVPAELVKQASAAAAIGGTSLVSMMLLWPYVFLNPIGNLVRSIQVLSHYPWNGLVLYKGTEYHAAQLPGDYLPTWLVIGSPPALVLLALLGLGVVGAAFVRTRRIEPQLATVVLAFGLPVAALLALHPALYDSLRQFLYVLPPMILLAAYGLVRSVTWLWQRHLVAQQWAAAGLVALTAASYALVAAEMVSLSPFEYTYFSPIVGGLAGASGKYDTDYWASCSKASAEWLAQNYQRYTRTPSPSVEGPVVEGTPMQALIAPFLPSSFHEDDAHPQFVIAFTRDDNDRMYPSYPVVHVVAAEGVRLCVVKVDPASAT